MLKRMFMENNFEHTSKPQIMELLEKYHYTAITVRLTGDYAKIYERFAKRDRSPERHRGHVVNDCYPERSGSVQENPTMMTYEGLLWGIEHRGFDDFCAKGPLIVVDTTNIAEVDMEGILGEVRKYIE